MSYFINHVDKKPGRSESTSGFFAVFLSMISLYSAYIQPIFSLYLVKDILAIYRIWIYNGVERLRQTGE